VGHSDARVDDPAPGLRRRVRSLGIVGLVLGLVYAVTAISDPPVPGFDAVHPWLALACSFVALTSARRTSDAPFGTPGGHLLRAGLWFVMVISAVWNVVQYGGGDLLLILVGIPTALAALANTGVRVQLARVH
jgi:hypothetical protein